MIESTADRISRVLRKTDEQQLMTFTEAQNQRVTRSQTWPSQRSLLERLL